MELPDSFKKWFKDYDVINNKIWSWDDTDQQRILQIAWRAYNKGVTNTQDNKLWTIKRK